MRTLKSFKGNEAASKLVASLAKLTAVRALGRLTDEKLTEFGLKDSKKVLTLISGSDKRVFLIGEKTFGNSDFYALEKDSGRVFVLRPKLIDDLKFADFRLIDQRLYEFSSSDVDRLEIAAADGGKRSLVQRNRRDPRNAFWGKANEEQKSGNATHGWVTKLMSVRSSEYLTDKPADIKELMSAKFSLGSREIGWVKFFSGPGKPNPLRPAEKPADEYYALSSNTRAYVKLIGTQVEPLYKDLPTVIKD